MTRIGGNEHLSASTSHNGASRPTTTPPGGLSKFSFRRGGGSNRKPEYVQRWLWGCCCCGHGMMDCEATPGCPNCGHMQCLYCNTEDVKRIVDYRQREKLNQSPPEKNRTLTPSGSEPSSSYTPCNRPEDVSPQVSSPESSASSSSSCSPSRSRSASPALLASNESLHDPPRRIVTEGNFRIDEFGDSRSENWEAEDEAVIRPDKCEDASSDAGSANSVVSSNDNDLDATILSGIKNLYGDDDEGDTSSQALREESRKNLGSSKSVQKRILTSDTDENDITVEATETGSGGKRFRRKIGSSESLSLIFDEPLLGTEKVHEDSGKCEELATADKGEDQNRHQHPLFDKEQPYYRAAANEILKLTPSNKDNNETQDVLEECSCPSQTSSMMDLWPSEDTTDWGEDSEVEHDIYRKYGHWSQDIKNSLPSFNADLEPTKKELIDRLMDDFWVIFNQNSPTGIRQRAGESSSSSSTSRLGSTNQRGDSSGKRTAKRSSSNGKSDENHDEDSERDSGRTGKRLKTASGLDQSPGFACPYRKRNPRKYCIRNWHRCVLTPHKTVARVKGHLYRYHLIHQCQRCKAIFKTDEELDLHIETSENCDAKVTLPVDGVTRKIKAQLQCKKKAFQGQTEAERWQQVYQTLFPDDDPVPDPYFEPVHDSEESKLISRDLTNLTDYEHFLRRYLPNFVRSALETAVNNEIQPIEERLRGQILDLVGQAQNRAFHTYRAMVVSSSSTNPLSDSGHVSSPSRTIPSPEGNAINFTANSHILPTDHPIAVSDAGPVEVREPGIDISTGFQYPMPNQLDLTMAHMNPSEPCSQTEETASSDLLWVDGHNMSNLSVLPSQLSGLDPEFDFSAFMWEFPLEADRTEDN